MKYNSIGIHKETEERIHFVNHAGNKEAAVINLEKENTDYYFCTCRTYTDQEYQEQLETEQRIARMKITEDELFAPDPFVDEALNKNGVSKYD